MDDSDVLPRQGFSQMARNMRCQLYFPYPTEQVVLLRTGVLHHINTYMQALGLAPPSAPKQAPANGLPHHADKDSPRHQHAGDAMGVDAAQGHQHNSAALGLAPEEAAADDAVASAQRDVSAAATGAKVKGLSTSAAPDTGLQNRLAEGLGADQPSDSPKAMDVDAAQGNTAPEVLASLGPACAMHSTLHSLQFAVELVVKSPLTPPGHWWSVSHGLAHACTECTFQGARYVQHFSLQSAASPLHGRH